MDVSFIQWLALKAEKGYKLPPLVTTFKEFQETKHYDKINLLKSDDYLKLLQSKSRQRMDVYLPRVFMVLWLLLVLFVAFIFLTKH